MKLQVFKLIGAVTVAGVMTVGPAWLHGNHTRRWNPPEGLKDAGQKLDAFPKTIGPWALRAQGDPLSDAVCAELGLTGSLSRTYINPKTGETIGLLLMVGESGRLVRHPPYICYDNRANQQVGDIEVLTAATEHGTNSFSDIEYKRAADPMGTRFMVAYGFSVGKEWKSPKWPRIEYGGEPVLFKAQVLTTLEGDERLVAVERQRAFIAEFARAFSKWHAQAARDGVE